MSLKKILVCSAVGLIAVVITWLLLGESSPLTLYFKPHDPPLAEVWRKLHTHIVFLVYVMNVRVTREGFFDSCVLVFFQWFAIAFLVGKLFDKRTVQAMK